MIDKIIMGLCAAGVIACAAWYVRGAKENPMDARQAALHARLAEIQPQDIQYTTTSGVDYVELMARIAAKPSLWNELIPPPPPPPPPPPVIIPPDLRKMLEGVSISLKQQLRSGDSIKPLFRIKGNPRGEFMGVGDQINGVTIQRVLPESVLFALVKDGIEYTVEIERQ